MAGTRGHYRDSITGQVSGQLKVLDGATVYVYKVGTTTQITTVYSASSGATTFTQPLISNSNGVIEFWLDGEQNVDLNITKTGYTTTTVTVMVSSPDTVVPTNTANAAFQVDDVTNANAATGLKLTSNAAGSGVDLAVVSSGTNENLTLEAKGSGTITVGSITTVNSSISADIMGQQISVPVADTALIDTNYQAVVYGTYTVNGILTVNGRLTVASFPT